MLAFPWPWNTVANYIPLKNFLAMVDEGQRFNRGM